MPANNPNKAVHLSDGVTVIYIERKGRVLPCLIDTADYELVRSHRWYALKGRLLPPDAKQVDHEDGNGINNQRHNLRPATTSQNAANRRRVASVRKYRGVHWREDRRKFRAIIKVNGKNLQVGYFTNEEDAARAYNAAAVQHFGEFAKLNDVRPAQIWKAA